MDSKNIKSILQDVLEDEMPVAEIDLLPAVQSRLVAGKKSSLRQGETMNQTQMRQLAYSVLAFVTLLAIILATPQGRAFAQKMFQFFAITDEKSFPLPTEMVFPVPETPTKPPAQLLPLEPIQVSQSTPSATPDTSCSSSTSQATYFCQIKAAEVQAGFDAREFPYDPKGLKFSTAGFIPETGELRMEFVVITGGGYLYLRQGIADFPVRTDPWSKAPSDAVEQVSVNGQDAEIVSGTFVVYPGATSAVWEPGGQLRLAWREGNRWVALEKMGDPYPIEWITKEELVKLAESLVNERPVDAVQPLDPEYLTTVEQAEALAGFHVPTPTLLPAGYELKRVVWAYGETVHLLYGPKNSSKSELFIRLGQLTNFQAGPCTECPPGVIETVRVGPWQGWYWRGIFFTGPATPGKPTPTPVWDGGATYWSLAWNTDKLWIGISYSPSFNSGKEMNKETLIRIAESME